MAQKSATHHHSFHENREFIGTNRKNFCWTNPLGPLCKTISRAFRASERERGSQIFSQAVALTRRGAEFQRAVIKRERIMTFRQFSLSISRFSTEKFLCITRGQGVSGSIARAFMNGEFVNGGFFFLRQRCQEHNF